MSNPFKKGDKVVCIKQPPEIQYQCKVGVKVTVKFIGGSIIYTVEEICHEYTNKQGACYQSEYFKLYNPTISFKKIHHSTS